MAHAYPGWFHPAETGSSQGSKPHKIQKRTGGRVHNGIQRCLSRRNNTIGRFSRQPVLGGGSSGHTTRFLAEPSESTMALSWDIIVDLWPNAISGERLVTPKVETDGESAGLLTERVRWSIEIQVAPPPPPWHQNKTKLPLRPPALR